MLHPDSFRNRLLILFAGLSFGLGFITILYISKVASEQMTKASGLAIYNSAKNISDTLGNSLTEREREIVLLGQAPLIAGANFKHPQVRQQLDQVKKSYLYYAWLGIANPSGKVEVAADGLLEGADVSDRPWFTNGIEQVYLGDVHKAVLLAKKIKAINPQEPLRFIDFATPIHDPKTHEIKGVLSAHADWSWAGHVLNNALPDDAARQGIEVFIVNRDGEVLFPFKSIGQVKPPVYDRQQVSYFLHDWDENQSYLTTDVPVISNTNTDLGWHVIIRQPVSTALAEVKALQHQLTLIGLLISFLLLYVTYKLANRFSYPIEKLARTASAVEQGEENVSFELKTSIREIKGLSQSLKSMTTTLLTQKQQLLEVNATLEQKVLERTQALELANSELENLARHDVLTGLHNRRAFNDYIEQLFAQLQRNQQIYSVLLLDIDYFKKINDGYGHEMGDHVLQSVATILATTLRATDFVARFGGEEFIVILPATSLNDAVTLAEKIRLTIANQQMIEDFPITISIGVSEVDLADHDRHDAIRRADTHLYRAKAQGRNQVVYESQSS